MKSYLPYSLILAAAASGMAFGAATAYTTPVGYVKIGDSTVGQPSIKANTDVAVSIPVLQSAVFAGTVASFSGNVITITGTPGFTASPAAGSFAPSTGIPYVVQIGSGAKSGLIAMVTSNGAGTITISPEPGDSLTGVLSGDKISVRLAWTVKNLFANNPVPAGTQILAYSGAVPGVNLAADLIYEFDGVDWVDTNSFSVANNVLLFPSESFIIRNPSASPIASLVLSGEVNVANSRTVLPASGVQQDIAFSFFGSVGEVIGTSGLGAISAAGDQVLLSDNSTAGFNKAGTTIIEWDGTAWIDTNSFSDVTATFKLEAGVGYFLRSAPSANRPYSNQPDYVPSL